MKEVFKFTKFFFSGTLTLIASLASIIGLIFAIFLSTYATLIALSSLIIFLIIILFRIFHVTKIFILQKTENGYLKFATYVRYSTEDSKSIKYELHKYLQCKSIIMDEHIHEFYWTGSEEPNISSDLQVYKSYVRTPPGEMDKAIFKFKKPLTYNDFGIAHIRMDLDDSNHKSQTYCEQAIVEPVQLISFRIELRYKTWSPTAKVSRKRMRTQVDTKYETIEHVKFDTVSMSYETIINNPEVGYYYRIEWDR